MKPVKVQQKQFSADVRKRKEKSCNHFVTEASACPNLYFGLARVYNFHEKSRIHSKSVAANNHHNF